tara:strand:- start:106 stop:744 length:639 start_codon:yes stop_codon:yes gene_type:complete
MKHSSQGISNDFLACPDCDALMTRPTLKAGEKATCPRCGSTVWEYKQDTFNRTLAVSLAGLLAFFPAMFLPLIGLETYGFSHQTSIVGAIRLLFNDGYYFVSLTVALFIGIFPVFRLLIVSYLLWRLNKRNYSPHLLPLYRWFFQFREWEMLEVFLLGVVISLYKLLSLADVIYGLGLAAFVFLMVCSILVIRLKDPYQVWQMIEEQANGKR